MLKQKLLFLLLTLLTAVACLPQTDSTPISSDRVTPTLLPTPTLMGNETETAVSPSLPSTATITPSPATSVAHPLTPSSSPPAPPPIWTADLDPAAWTQGIHQAAIDLVNWAQGDTAVMTAQMVTWGQVTPSSIQQTSSIPSAWAQRADLDDDGIQELLLSMPRLESWCEGENCNVVIPCQIPYCPAQLFIFEPQGSGFVLVHRFGRMDTTTWADLNYPQIFSLSDLNQDGFIELIISEEVCGAHTCQTNLTVGQWHDGQWHNLGSFGQPTSQISLSDWNRDGLTDFILHGGTVSSAGAGLQRPHTLVYTWQNGRYELFGDFPDAGNNPYFLILDAHTALTNGDLENALSLAAQALNPPPGTDLAAIDDWAGPRIGAYAGIEAMLVHALRGETAEMQSLLTTIETNYQTADNPYVPAAQTLWQTYQQTGDAGAACQAMAAVLQATPEQAQFFEFIGYNMEVIPLEAICPLING